MGKQNCFQWPFYQIADYFCPQAGRLYKKRLIFLKQAFVQHLAELVRRRLKVHSVEACLKTT